MTNGSQITENQDHIVKSIIDNQKADPSCNFVEDQSEIDGVVYRLYGLREEEGQEAETWFARRYPSLRRDVDFVDVDEG